MRPEPHITAERAEAAAGGLPTGDRPRRVGIASHGLWQAREDIAGLLNATPVKIKRGSTPAVDIVAGWGFKPTAAFARAFAKSHQLPYIALEDGFLRSVRPGSSRSLSYVVDGKGIYYDANQPSDLEALLQDTGWLEPDEEQRGLAASGMLRALRVSKYNTTKSPSAHAPIGILVVDQTAGDASISGSLASADTFWTMLDAAIAKVGRERVYVKLHPETIAGRKPGHLSDAAERRGVRLVDKDYESWAVVEASREVYVVSSQLGFEALLAGVPVTCFGVPFYAGWGLTSDVTPCPRRTGRPSLGALAAAALFRYTQYLDPWTRRRIPFEEAVDALAFLRDRFQENATPSVLVAMSSAKQRAMELFLDGPGGSPIPKPTVAQAVAAALPANSLLVVWGTRHPEIDEKAQREGLRVVRVEDGFIRSAGLGAAFVPSYSFAFDDLGIHYDPSRPSRLEVLAQTMEFTPSLMRRAAKLRAALIAGGVTKYSAIGRKAALPEDGRRKILAIGQVEDDASVLLGAPDAGGNLGLLQRARAHNPDALIVYRPHPDVSHGYRKGRIPEPEALRHADLVAADVQITDLLDWCDGVEVLTSLTGFEALIRGKSVRVHGRPFYGGWGLTDDLVSYPRRTRRLSLDELVAVTLIAYPRYVDPVSLLPCRVETLVQRLSEHRLRKPGGQERMVETARHLSALFRHTVIQPFANAWYRRR